MIITKKTRLLPPFVGTQIKIELDDPESLTWGIYRIKIAEGHEKAVIDWGDGQREEVIGFTEVTHLYAQTGVYNVRLSDDISSLQFSTKSSVSPFRVVYAKMIREFATTAKVLNTLETYSFNDAANLRKVSTKGSSLRVISSRTFGLCPSLGERVDLHEVSDVNATAFYNSTGISELHFSAAKEDLIRGSAGWRESGGNFGAVNATVSFDL